MWRRFICSIARKTKRRAHVGEIEPIQAELQVGAMTNRARTPPQIRWPRFAGGAILCARLMEKPIERDLKRNYGSNAACGCVRVQPTSSMQSRFRRARIGSAPWGTMKALIVGLESEEGRGGLELGGEGRGKEAIWFAEERGRVERFPRLKLGRRRLRFVRSVYAQQINFLGGPPSLASHSS